MATDRQLLSWLHGRHSDSALTELLKRYGAMVRRAALRITGHAHAADDVGQAVFLLVVRKSRRLEAERVLCGWVYRMAVRASREWLKTESRREEKGTGSSGRERSAAALPADFDRALMRLAAAAREAIVARYLCGMIRREAAASLGIAEGELDARASAALSRLHRRLGRKSTELSLSALTGMLSAECAATESGVAAAQGRAIIVAAFDEARASVDLLAREAARGLAVERVTLVAVGLSAFVISVVIVVAGLLAMGGRQFFGG